jgi:hypothetical protein
MRGKPGSQINMWIEDEAPDIVITSPWDDTVSNGPVTVAGYVADRPISKVAFDHNGATFDVPVTDGNFSVEVSLVDVNNITVSAVDSTGTLRYARLLLDGDYLPMKAELAMGFDPLNPDSNSDLTPDNEAGNGMPDGLLKAAKNGDETVKSDGGIWRIYRTLKENGDEGIVSVLIGSNGYIVTSHPGLE